MAAVSQDLEVRSPTREEMAQVVALMNEEGWNVQEDVYYDLYDLHPDSSKVVVDHHGQVLSEYSEVTIIRFFLLHACV